MLRKIFNQSLILILLVSLFIQDTSAQRKLPLSNKNSIPNKTNENTNLKNNKPKIPPKARSVSSKSKDINPNDSTNKDANSNDSSKFYTIVSRGNTKYNGKDYVGAIEEYSQAIQLETNNSIGYHYRAQARRDKGDFLEAINDHQKAITLDPKNSTTYQLSLATTYNNYAVELAKKGSNQDAITFYEKSLELNPENANVYYNRGLVNVNLENYDNALTDLLKAKELNFKDSNLVLLKIANVYYNRGLVNINLENYDNALTDLLKAKELNFEETDLLMLIIVTTEKLAIQQVRKDNYEGAINSYKSLLELYPKNSELYKKSLSRVYLNRANNKIKNKDNTALEDISDAIKIDERSSFGYYLRGNLRADRGEYSEALSDYNQAILINPTYANVYVSRAKVYEKQGKKGEAKKDMERAKKLGFNPTKINQDKPSVLHR